MSMMRITTNSTHESFTEGKKEEVKSEIPKEVRRPIRPSKQCKQLHCQKYALLKGYCRQHMYDNVEKKLVDEWIERKRLAVGPSCKFQDCSKRTVLKGYCTRHAREMVDKAVVEEYDHKVKTSAARCKDE